MSWVALTASVVLLAANAFFVAVEFGLIATRRTSLEEMAEGGSRMAARALDSSRDLSRQLAGAQLGITMASLLLGYVAEPAIGHALEEFFGHTLELSEGASATLGLVIGLSIVVSLHMVLGEMVPKNIAIAGPERTLLALTIPNRIYLFLFGPVVTALNWLANSVLWVLGVEPADELTHNHTPEELATMVADSRDEGVIPESHGDLLSAALGLGSARVDRIMVPRDRIDAIGRTATPADLEAAVLRTGHSRLVVIGDDLDDVLGYVHAKDLLGLAGPLRDRPLPLGRVRRIPVVEPSAPIDNVIRALRTARVHLALVSDGVRTLGLVALEDALEELVGDIVDESD